MNDMKKNIRRVFWLFFTMFAITVLYLTNFMLIESNNIINSTLNPRVRISRPNVKRGQILDKNGIIIAQSIPFQESYARIYNYDNTFSHVVGFVDSVIGHSGVEERYNFSLQNLSFEIIQRIQNIASNSHLQGDSIVLTIDGELQKLAYNLLGNSKGSIVALDPSTGRILTMVSYPNFNPNEIAADWSRLNQDTGNSPLLNRATQGLYPPGSVFKILTSVSAMEHLENFEDFVHDCTGSITIDENSIRCYNYTAHGIIDMADAFAVSCNTYFVALAEAIGAENLRSTADASYFNQLIPFRLPNSASRFTLDENDDVLELMQASIGQGRVVVTPLHMAMLAGALANDGAMMHPYVVDHIVTRQDRIRNVASPQILTRLFTYENNSKLHDMMVQAVESGTGAPASVSGVQVGGKTGTAENDRGEAHGWFVAFASNNGSQIALAVMLENSGGAARPLVIARNLIQFYLQD